jgi:hypothetical protein
MLARQPATARFISTKLAERFVSDEPPQELVDAMAKIFLKSDGDIKAVLHTMLSAPEFWDKNEYRAKVKTPLEFAVSAIRATNAEMTRPQSVADALNRMGMPLYGAQPPTGYSMLAASWVNSGALLSRMNFALGLSTGKLAGVRVDTAKLTGGAGKGDVERALEQSLVNGEVSAQTHETIARQLNEGQTAGGKLDATRVDASKLESAKTDNSRINKAAADSTKTESRPPTSLDQGAVAGLILGSPEFQRR